MGLEVKCQLGQVTLLFLKESSPPPGTYPTSQAIVARDKVARGVSAEVNIARNYTNLGIIILLS